MKRDRHGRVTLEFPDDYRGFTHAGVRFVRLSELHERGRYRATPRSGRPYTITGGHSKRYPWRASGPAWESSARRSAGFANLVEAAEGIAFADATMLCAAPQPVTENTEIHDPR